MTIPPAKDVTQLLLDWSSGKREAMDDLLPLVYKELRQLADRYLRRERSDHTLQATALVHEAYLKLIDQRNVQWQNRAHFFGVAAQAMRRILVDHARNHQAAKRGSGGQKISLDEGLMVTDERAHELVALDDALNELAGFDEQKGRIVELRFFGGLTIEETAEVLGIGTATVIREWRMAKAWLYQSISGDEPESTD
ncbi:MAG TPA: sigma-70 family RNA polymerase sigma factor [Pyrinomonadaceae bacterium]|jgi:RNA polymerase sigma factor (TIGR02999 family)|nr:sigma-70 family RNA polymerase sigma factor [Pyrinomonadaceae bacterium]